jgi:hypothetical protein
LFEPRGCCFGFFFFFSALMPLRVAFHSYYYYRFSSLPQVGCRALKRSDVTAQYDEPVATIADVLEVE